MTDFGDDLAKFAEKAQARARTAFNRVTEEIDRSVVEGSTITGAAGQPIDTGNLKSSWIPERLSETEWQLTATGVASDGTVVGYAIHVEDNVRGVTFKNHGAHSVALTIAGFGAIVESVTKGLAS